ncbi:uncharacterized protein LOC110231353 [Exaiptasia diaphana]|uniref:Uncharacterized protein n=1 Tax=Exaiptasia diaphana TaxID=2652724 RepID=A0A913WPB1_EXADI|nr:uncharacterized protein LOC110231353 [Exaiptasia diaphana]KXJ19088.1 hypothetical protein AC249_AIPGENE14255 [Exaiptasia diaphana]
MKVELSLYFTIIILVCQQALIKGAFQNCKPYKIIHEDDYDKDPSTVSDSSKHPNGFYWGNAKYPATSTNLNNVCVFITNVTDRAVGVMVQPLIIGKKICVKDDGGSSECGETISKCFEANSDTAKYEFYCDPGKGCDTDVQFWYRLRPSEGDKDDWCTLIRDGNDFPNSLFLVPTKETPNKISPTSGGSTLNSLSIGLIISIGLIMQF